MNSFIKKFAIVFVAVFIASFFMVKLGAIGVVLFIVVLLGGMFWIFKSMGGGMSNLLKGEDIPNGVSATATVISSRQGNMRISMGVQQSFQLIIEVNVTNGQETWPATIKAMIPLTQVGVFQPGVSFSVKYDPNNRSRVIIDQSAGQQQQQHTTHVPGVGDYTTEMRQQGMAAAPIEISTKLAEQSTLINELSASPSAIKCTATIISSTKLYTNIMPGANVYNLKVKVNGNTSFDGEITCSIAAVSEYKIANGKNIYVIYDGNNPRRLGLTGLDQPNSAYQV
ncbi:MAG: hypothetical protein H3C31_01485 [Brumimicrobium sp.]|nr:hypothetical protein [Brumimicrobium sp.]